MGPTGGVNKQNKLDRQHLGRLTINKDWNLFEPNQDSKAYHLARRLS